MPDPGLSQFTTVFRASEPRRIKRNRQPVSCTACQKRKSRCDRRQPCAACEKRGDAPSCHFGPTASAAAANPGQNRTEVQDRLSKLEALVKQLAEEQTGARHGVHVQDGHVDVHTSRAEDAARLEYRGPTSWASVVDNIHDIQSALEAEDSDQGPESDVLDVTDILCGSSRTTMDEILQVLPSRTDVDKLISAYLNAKFMSIPFIHPGQFRRQYDKFWADPTSISMCWISILFSIMSCGIKITLVKTISLSSGPESRDASLYMNMAAKCLVTGQYLKGSPHSVEALIAHVHSRHIHGQDSDATLWTMFGTVVRMAQRHGYHREAHKVSAKISLFEAEMRRRVWFTIMSYDLLWSIQQGMPPMIHEDTCDTALPLNMADEDFDENSMKLVPRPATEPLPILAYITKYRLLHILHPVVRHALGIKRGTAADAAALGTALDKWHENVPACLKYRPIRESSFTDASHTIYHRNMLEMTYHTSRCVLMRSFLSSRGQSGIYTHALAICRESALQLIAMQVDVYSETQPGGRLYEDRFMVSSLSLFSFLIAAMILVLELHDYDQMPYVFPCASPACECCQRASQEERAHCTQVLRSTQKMWETRSDTSADAAHVKRILKAMLRCVDSPGWQSESDTLCRTTHAQEEEPEKASERNPWSDGVLPTGSHGFPEGSVGFDATLPMESFFNDVEGLDWVGPHPPGAEPMKLPEILTMTAELYR
ncbi:putative transcriptional regulatory protein-like protein [Emericellopsis cladophorae]|uniref:Transcriptional regulatory protein-like protein n=1 Tax=Emericellopsis cladophorae TaxID=2686198 RepID=A0A9P9Y7V5_9HYPO|nr:putative transcriptional regulatory protein-like protein [Emericellopsis cladophorae]KAI6784424.1 putative transcriptional regulatory protein-like protein [Emericellopsis cladophorae]